MFKNFDIPLLMTIVTLFVHRLEGQHETDITRSIQQKLHIDK